MIINYVNKVSGNKFLCNKLPVKLLDSFYCTFNLFYPLTYVFRIFEVKLNTLQY